MLNREAWKNSFSIFFDIIIEKVETNEHSAKDAPHSGGGEVSALFPAAQSSQRISHSELFDSALLGIFFGAAWMPAKIKFAVQMLAGAVGGLLRNISGISAGTFLCSTVAVLVLKLSFNFAFLPHWIKEIASLSAAVISEAL